MSQDDLEFDITECLARVREDDSLAAQALVEHLYPMVAKIVRSKLPRRDAEEDLMQEVFVKMFANLDQYEGEVPIDRWVSRIAVNHCLNALRAQKARPEWRWADLTEQEAQTLDAVLTSGAAEPHPAHVIGARDIVEKMLASLGPEDALLMRMLELEERSVEEVREITGWSATRIRVRAFRARRRLNKRFAAFKAEVTP